MKGFESDDDRQQWAQRFTALLEAHLSFAQVVREQMAVEIPMLTSGVAPTADLLGALYEALLSQWGSGVPAGPLAPWRAQVAVEQHEMIEIVLEGASTRGHWVYEDYLGRHWQGIGTVGPGSDRFVPLLALHAQAVGAALQAGQGASQLHARLLELHQDWLAKAGEHAQAVGG